MENITRLSQNELITEILKRELVITKAVIKGHRPLQDDEFQEFRDDLVKLRTQLNSIQN